MRICVVGCGAIGSLFAAHLGRLPGVEVWAFDVSAAQVRAINTAGLRLTGTSAVVSGTPRVQARSDGAQIPSCQLGIVAVKAQHTAAAMAATAGVFRDAAVCSVQNGIGNEEIVAQVRAPGHPRHHDRGRARSRARGGAPGRAGR